METLGGNFPEIQKKPVSLEDIKNPEIAALYKPLENLVEKIKNAIENGEYGLIIGEDTSGRIPALVFNKIVKSVYEKKDQQSPQVLFMSGIRLYSPEHSSVDKERGQEFQKYIKDTVLDKKRKALVITEYIKYGNSILPIVQSLKANGIPYDIAACVLNDASYEMPISRRGATPIYNPDIANHVYYGIDGDEVEALPPDSPLRNFIYNKTTKFSGVARQNGDIVASHANNLGEGEPRYNQMLISEARGDVAILADLLIEKNFKE